MRKRRSVPKSVAINIETGNVSSIHAYSVTAQKTAMSKIRNKQGKINHCFGLYPVHI